MDVSNREVINMKPVEDQSCYQYWLDCTDMYGEYYSMQHFSKKHYKSEIKRDIDALAAYMRIELGISKGDVYTVFMPTTIQSIVAFYALNKIGVIVNFVHPLLPPEALKEAIEEGHSKGVMILDLLSEKYVDVINKSGLPCLVCHSSDYGNIVKTTGTKGAEAIIKKKYPKINNRDEYKSAVKRFAKANVQPDCDCDDIAVYLNGGGTTGKSKTIMLTSRAINELACRVSRIDRIHQPGIEAEIIVLPLFHCFGLCLAVHMAMCNGARLIPMMQFDAKLFNYLMKTNNVIAVVGIPVMFKKLMAEKHFEG
ncbi:MAG: acyl--CoA ligase, partial [Clostridia bacterium]|nr:acyl--CoA ligase [Clostridia bacterium]